MDHQGEETQNYSFGNGKRGKKRECCLCGDVGFQERLFRCHRCHHRLQHIYCSRLYSDQLELGGENVCDWCQDLEAKEKNQSQKRKVELQEMENRKAKEVAANEIVSTSASTSAMKQPALATIEKPKKGNAKYASLKFHIKFGGNKQSQNQNQNQPPLTENKLSIFGGSKQSHNQNQPSLTENKPSIESCKKLSPTSESSSPKGGMGRRYKLLSDVLS